MMSQQIFRPFALRCRWWILSLFLIGLVACHKVERNNPFDPALTPAVELVSVHNDSTTGIVTLTWTRYEGDQPFAAYKILRNIVERTRVDTLTGIPDVTHTVYDDTARSPNTDYEYRVAVVNATGFVHPSEPYRVPAYPAGPVELLEAAVDERAGVAVVRWSRYRGGRFTAYQVERRGGDAEEFEPIHRIETVDDTVYTDTTLRPEVRYTYQIVVKAAGQPWVSNPLRSVGFSLSSVEVFPVEIDPSEGSAEVRWSRFQGARFEAYRVERREGAFDFEPVHTEEVVDDTVFVDRDLRPDVVVVYRVVVEAAGQEWPSDQSNRVSFSPAPVNLLAVTTDAGTGTIRLRWTRFVGPGFESYRIERSEVGEEYLPLDNRTVVGDTTFVDGTAKAGVAYVYRVVVVWVSGRELSSAPLQGRLTLSRITLFPVVFSSEQASATLSWTRYSGPRFRAYRVVRGTTTLPALQEIKDIPEISTTSFTDSGLVGNTEYVYRVVVTTDREEEVMSGEQRGGIHRLLTTWSVEMDEGEYGRLYVEPDDRIVLLLAGPDRVRLKVFDTEGNSAGERMLLTGTAGVAPRSVATTLTPEGNRLLSLGLGGTFALLLFGQDGRPIPEEYTLSDDAFPEMSGEAERRVNGEIALWSTSPEGSAAFDNVTVSRNGDVLFEDDFEDGNSRSWSTSSGNLFENGSVSTKRGTFFVSKTDSAWHDIRLEADLTVEDRTAGIRIGSLSGLSSLSLMLSHFTHEAVLGWSFQPPSGQGLTPRSGVMRRPFPVLNGIPYRLGLEAVAGRVRASAKAPVFWTVAKKDPRAAWGSVVASQSGVLFLTEDRDPYIVSREGTLPDVTSDFPVSEIRVWTVTDVSRAIEFGGVCLPQANSIIFGISSIRTRSAWPSSSPLTFLTAKRQFRVTSLGLGVGREAGQFLYPLSFDVGPDGRLFVLDVGNARIQVFNLDGAYLTQWGSRGNEDGQFDFGNGNTPENFRGSVAVDSYGAIYVLDAGNRRIQKFSP